MFLAPKKRKLMHGAYDSDRTRTNQEIGLLKEFNVSASTVHNILSELSYYVTPRYRDKNGDDYRVTGVISLRSYQNQKAKAKKK